MTRSARFLVAFLLVPSASFAQDYSHKHELLNSVLWNQTAAEFAACANQAYQQARVQLDLALETPDWTAAPEQTGDFQSLPPAVVLDIDETVLNNSPYEAALAYEDTVFSPDTWFNWVSASKAEAIPGALAFCQYAAGKGVQVIYVSNRAAEEEAATLVNLQELDFPVDEAGEFLLCNNEQPDWGSDKTTRRAFVAQSYRILLLVGDDMNDFVSGTRTGTAARNEVTMQNIGNVGEKWILIPNDMYGGWEQGVFNRDRSLSREQVLQVKFEALEPAEAITPAGTLSRVPGQNHELLSAALWTQTAGEYIGYCNQTYRLAMRQLDLALADPSWTAAVEQTGDYAALEPAVVLDIDETVLDNSPYEASLVWLDAAFDSDSWDVWVKDESAEPVPGALEFCQYADERGVRVIYNTNRDASQEAATLANLKMKGFPVDDAGEYLLTSNEQAGWGSDKITRRQHIAQTHRILLLVGDDMNDFVTGTRTGTEARNAVAAEHMHRMGQQWFILPNSMYGGWESGVFNRDFSLSREQILRVKHNALNISYTALSGAPHFNLYR